MNATLVIVGGLLCVLALVMKWKSQDGRFNLQNFGIFIGGNTNIQKNVAVDTGTGDDKKVKRDWIPLATAIVGLLTAVIGLVKALIAL